MSADKSDDEYALPFSQSTDKEITEDKSGGEDAANRKRNASETRNLRSSRGKSRKMEEQLSKSGPLYRYARQTGTEPRPSCGPETSDGKAIETGASSKRRAKKVVEKSSEPKPTFGAESSKSSVSKTGTGKSLKRRTRTVKKKSSEPGLSSEREPLGTNTSGSSSGNDSKRKTRKVKEKSSFPGLFSQTEPPSDIYDNESVGREYQKKKSSSPEILFEAKSSARKANKTHNSKDSKGKTNKGDEQTSSPEPSSEQELSKSSANDEGSQDGSQEGSQEGFKRKTRNNLDDLPELNLEDRIVVEKDWVLNYTPRPIPPLCTSPLAWYGDGFLTDNFDENRSKTDEHSLASWLAGRDLPEYETGRSRRSLEDFSPVSESGEKNPGETGSEKSHEGKTRSEEENSSESRPWEKIFNREGALRSYERRTRMAEEQLSEPGPSGRNTSETVIHNAFQSKTRVVEKQSSGSRPSFEPGRYSGREPSPEPARYSGREPSPEPARYSGREPSPEPRRYSEPETSFEPRRYSRREPSPQPGPSSRPEPSVPGPSFGSRSRAAFGPEPTLQDLVEDTKEVLLGANQDLNRLKEMLMQQVLRREQDVEMVDDLMELRQLMRTESRKILRKARKLRFRDILIFGSDIKSTNVVTLEMAVERFLQEKMDLTVSISNAEVVGQPGSSLSFIIARLEDAQDRFAIFERIDLLPRNIMIRDNLCQKEREEQKEISDFVKAEKAKGHDVQEGCGKVYINNKWRHWDKVKKRTSDNDPSEQEDEEREQPPEHPYTERLLNIKARLVHNLFQGITDATPSTSGT